MPPKKFFVGAGRWRGADGWPELTLAVVVSVPVLVVLAHVFVPAGDVWRHLAETVLARHVTNSLWLMLGVGVGTLVTGV